MSRSNPNDAVIDEALIAAVNDISVRAGQAILKVYETPQDVEVITKDDNSPVTQADIAAHCILKPELEALIHGIPVLSEESQLPSFEVRRQWRRYWIIDPLDGTKEFINRNGEFTVNVALIEDGVPVFGVVHVPVLDITYGGARGLGAWKVAADGVKTQIQVRGIGSRRQQQLPIEIVASRRHGAAAVDALLERIAAELGSVATKSMGSSLKLCLVAEGEADLYPRLAPTSEWDTAAAQAVVEAAGGIVVDEHFNALRYNTKDDILNPFFYVIGDPSYDWRALLN